MTLVPLGVPSREPHRSESVAHRAGEAVDLLKDRRRDRVERHILGLIVDPQRREVVVIAFLDHTGIFRWQEFRQFFKVIRVAIQPRLHDHDGQDSCSSRRT